MRNKVERLLELIISSYIRQDGEMRANAEQAHGGKEKQMKDKRFLRDPFASWQGSEISLPYGSRRVRKDALKPDC